MNTLFAGFFGGWEIVLILAVVLILFGAKKLPELAKGLGQGIKEFKKATNEVSNEINSAMDDSRYASPRQEENRYSNPQIENPSASKPGESTQPGPASKA
jgi:sec-independent protein translocase protein TatA